MAEYSKLARGSFSPNQNGPISQTINLPFTPQKIEVWNTTQWGSVTSGNIFYSYWDASMTPGTCVNNRWNNTGTSPSTVYMTSNAVSTEGISLINNSSNLMFGPTQQVVSMTAANPPVVTVMNHGYMTGNVVVFEGLYQTTSTGMPQICTIPFVIQVIDANTFSIPWNAAQSNYTALTGSPANASVKQVLNPIEYFPGLGFISSMTFANNLLTIVLTTYTTCSVGQLVSFRIPPIWGTVQLNSGYYGVPIYGTVTMINSNQIFVSTPTALLSAFNSNIPIAAIHGLSYAQLVAVGDVNSGGGQAIQPVLQIPTINGPTIFGAFVNNTASGFILGINTCLNTCHSRDNISWEAKLYDYTQDI